MLSWFRQSDRKSEEPTPVIALDGAGFVVTKADEVTLRVDWLDVREIVAFKEDLWAYDDICVGFRTGDGDSYHHVTEEFGHYQDLMEELPRRFPGMRSDWWSEVAHPAFARNWTTLWVRDF